MDFGTTLSNIDKSKKYSKNAVVGTAQYLSPVLMNAYMHMSKKEVLHDLEKSDIYSLGILFL